MRAHPPKGVIRESKRVAFTCKTVPVFLLFLYASLGVGCSSVFPKFTQGESRTRPKQDLIRHIIDPKTFIGRFHPPVERSMPLIVGETLYVGSVHNRFFALKRKNGELQWEKKIPGGVEGTPIYYDQKIYVGANNGKFYCLEAESGKEIWSYDAKVEILSTPTVKGDIVFFTTANNGIYALKANTGAWVWYFNKGYIQKISVRGTSSPIYKDGKIYAGFSDGYFYAFNAFDGKVMWFKKLSKNEKFGDIDLAPIIQKDQIIVASFDGYIYALNPITGDEKWHLLVSQAGITGMTADEEKIYVTLFQGGVWATQHSNGKKVWEKAISGFSTFSPVLVEDQLIFTTSGNQVRSIAAESGAEIWYTPIQTGISSKPVLFKDKLYLFSNFSALHILDPFYFLYD
ncbi:MAG: PQQ-binding-like beta-propeller repeat protein [Deltaproteobacteria bacterium]|nr:PQQ-binding-like beta-propeller repeat protein [Deltaproteobacteria bacterium]